MLIMEVEDLFGSGLLQGGPHRGEKPLVFSLGLRGTQQFPLLAGDHASQDHLGTAPGAPAQPLILNGAMEGEVEDGKISSRLDGHSHGPGLSQESLILSCHLCYQRYV